MFSDFTRKELVQAALYSIILAVAGYLFSVGFFIIFR